MKNNIQKKELKEFGILIGIVFPILVGWLLPTLSGHSFRIWSLWISIPALILSQTRPQLLLYPYKTWMKIGYILGWLNSRIILGLVFILILQPIALIMKIFGYDPLRKSQIQLKKISFRESKKEHKIDLTRIF